MKHAQVILLTLFLGISMHAQNPSSGKGKSYSVRFDPPCEMPVSNPSQGLEEMLSSMRLGADLVPEGLQLVTLLTLFPDKLGVSKQQSETLRKHFAEVYAKMDADPAFVGLQSVINEGFATNPSRKGHYFAYVPESVSDSMQVIVFLHGYGGNFQFYLYLLKQAFPQHLIICPTWGNSWYEGNLGYLEAACKDASDRFGVKAERMWLFALSAGGPAGFRAVKESPGKYLGYVCIASIADGNQVIDVPKTVPVLVLAGVHDTRIPIHHVRKRSGLINEHGGNVELVELNSDHFFLLTAGEMPFLAIKEFMANNSDALTFTSKAEPANWLVIFLLPWVFTGVGLAFLCRLAILLYRKYKQA